MINMVKLPTSKSELFLRVAKGHFATSHSHINYYIDVTTQKSRLSEAKAVAKELVSAYQHSTIVDTVLCLDGGERLEDVAQAHQIEVQTLRSWVKKYREMGAAGLEDRRGQRLAEQLPRGKEEALRIENARLKRENELLKMELYLRKKVKELERGDR